jgi:DNA-binding beta-propeller fold protein YncE
MQRKRPRFHSASAGEGEGVDAVELQARKPAPRTRRCINLGGRKMSTTTRVVSIAIVLVATGCSPAAPPADLVNRAYVVSKNSDEVHVIDLNRLEILGVVHTGGRSGHMGELNRDFTELLVDSELSNESEIIDTASLTVVDKLSTPRHPTHVSLTRDGRTFAVMAEADDAVMILDAATHAVVATLPHFYLPHFMRMSLDGRYGYVANLRGNHITKVDLTALAVVEEIPLDGFVATTADTELADESGFADVQIDQVTGLLYAAHRGSGRVLVYDTVRQQKLPDLTVGKMPWIVYAEHPFAEVARRPVVPNFGDLSASVVSAGASAVAATLPFADQETYGVNYSPLVPDQAFLMNRQKQQIAVVDTAQKTLVDQIDVGGTTETASTTADGRFIVATVSSINRVVVIEAATHRIVKTFDGVGSYPWSVTIPRGQNYCH